MLAVVEVGDEEAVGAAYGEEGCEAEGGGKEEVAESFLLLRAGECGVCISPTREFAI